MGELKWAIPEEKMGTNGPSCLVQAETVALNQPKVLMYESFLVRRIPS